MVLAKCAELEKRDVTLSPKVRFKLTFTKLNYRQLANILPFHGGDFRKTQLPAIDESSVPRSLGDVRISSYWCLLNDHVFEIFIDLSKNIVCVW
ncbi:unnamed protein product [Adineta ricciae]|uniref:Uncharacterized protein n=1 Tax=Adineta ricciae TaxID=249248 RepID=A0A815TJE8_ADIRI|nr:unnamed protein product [Adineta ricciae]